MSNGWSGGSTRAWRILRARVLLRDGYRCQLQLAGCLGTAPLRGDERTPSGHVHHTLGRAVTGDDARYLVAACQPCNLRAGDPAKRADPPALPWSPR